MEIKGRVVVVTGGASGIGLDTCKAFAEAGARIAILDVNEDALATAKKEVGGDTLGV